MKRVTDKATCPKCKTGWPTKGTSPVYCDGHDCRILKPTQDPDRIVSVPRYPPEHLHCACFECGYGWLMECADAEPSPEENEPVTVYCPVDIDCPHCTERVELAVKIRCTNLKCFAVGDKKSVDAIVVN